MSFDCPQRKKGCAVALGNDEKRIEIVYDDALSIANDEKIEGERMVT